MSSEPIRIFHSRVAKENGSNGPRRYTVREKLSTPSRGLVWTLGRGALASGAGSLLGLEVSHVARVGGVAKGVLCWCLLTLACSNRYPSSAAEGWHFAR